MVKIYYQVNSWVKKSCGQLFKPKIVSFFITFIFHNQYPNHEKTTVNPIPGNCF
jgi:hypothetical protein